MANTNLLAKSILVFGILVLCGCRPPADEFEELETIDVEPGVEIEIADDQKAAVRKPQLVGVLPTDFPADLPLYLPSSLVDYGRDDAGRYISLLTPHGIDRVRGALPALLRDGGWRLSGDLGRSGAATLTKGSRQVGLRIENGRPGTLCRYTY